MLSKTKFRRKMPAYRRSAPRIRESQARRCCNTDPQSRGMGARIGGNWHCSTFDCPIAGLVHRAINSIGRAVGDRKESVGMFAGFITKFSPSSDIPYVVDSSRQKARRKAWVGNSETVSE